jgi:hypothetical protein
VFAAALGFLTSGKQKEYELLYFAATELALHANWAHLPLLHASVPGQGIVSTFTSLFSQ